MTRENLAQLQAFLKHYFGNDCYFLSPLDQGGTNRHFLISLEEREPQYFLKVFVTNSLQVVDRQQQFTIQQQLARQELAPQPVALSPCQQFWLEQWCQPGDTVSGGQKQASMLAKAMVKVHESKIEAPELDIKAEWLRYLAVAGENQEGYQERMAELLSAFGTKESLPNDFCFCHNDLHLSHVINSDPLRIVDWEYSAVGNRYFDIAACALVNEFDLKQLEDFIDHYSGYARIPKSTVASGVKRLLPVVDFTNELWHNAYTKIT